MDINTKNLKKNAFRVTKVRGYTASRVRIPGGHLNAEILESCEIAREYVTERHITTRQGFIPDILLNLFQDKRRLQPIIDMLEINQPVRGRIFCFGHTNIACIGNRVCPYACYDTTAFAKRIEKAVFPHDLHFKIALTGCPNDCAKVRMHDFGIMGMTMPVYDPSRCVSCGACEKYCRRKSVQAIEMVNERPVRNEEKCIGCGECVLNCPTRAWTRGEGADKRYRLTLFGRTGKRNPRLGEDFIKWVDEDSIIKIILNTYDYVAKYIDKDAPGGKEHIGYIVDRTGFEEYKKWALNGVKLPPGAVVYNPLYWKGIKYTEMTL